MKQFFKIFFASSLGFIFGFFVLLFIGIMILVSIGNNLESDEKVDIKEASILHFKPGMGIKERSVHDLSNFDLSTFELKSQQGLAEILTTLREASSDKRVKGLYLELDPTFTAGYSTIKEIHDALESFKDSGKFIIAYTTMIAEWGYYLASTADEIHLNPSGNFIFNGLYADVWFYKDALDKLGVEVQVFKHGTFKSAVEPYMLNEMSPANRMQVERYVGSLFNTYLTDISKSRNIDKSKLRGISNAMLIRTTKDAKELGLVDHLSYEDQVISRLKEKLELEEDDELPFVSMDEYLQANPPKKHIGADKVAVLYANGVIQEGEAETDVMSSDEMLEALREINKDDKIRALVLRINSPGGSAFASDLIYRELLLIKKKMPIIVSMGDVAASGGYYIAAMADTIVAHPNTITGSIGVFGLIPNMQGLLNNKLGIHSDGVKTGEYSDLGRIDRPMTPQERAIIQAFIEETYTNFTQIVSTHRGIPMTAMDSIAEGRVWTGEDALKIGLVDVLGGMPLAMELARERTGLLNVRVVNYPALRNPLDFLFSAKKDAMADELMKEELGEHYQIFVQYKKAMKMKGVQMRLPFDINVE
ncbi:MAG: signal peptide peptidase SppA [Bacteroidia bacterium]